ncbi:MAG: sulfatase [Parvibaculaceae bacterium]|mgnify:FL=1|nr:sulfatase [Parvibaculaceae bacterium]HBM88292.1 sulfatase [Rhodobiaceae bacterium]|tara:strand:+ start:14 stop:1552 length:1539 start_codon:yes stop_codon:yes gene_type:complete
MSEDQEQPVSTGPKNAVVILLDSLNRHMLGAYGGEEFRTPNLDRIGARSTKFMNHYVGSLPCMPARHDILCGALDFLWRPWGSIELWEDAITYELSKAGVTSQLISDHPHLFETGGENYHVDFSAWDYQRGHEGDLWKTKPDPSWAGAPNFGREHMPYDDSRGYFRGEADFPGPRTMQAAASWLEDNADQHDRFFLFVDEFDPHEPFDTPEPYASMYDPDWEGAHMIWPPYMKGALEKGVLTERQAQQIRACYGAKLTMIDHWLGKVLDVMDAKGLWDDTVFILCTDHGHYLGEKDLWGKPGVPIYQTLGHIPLMIAAPDVQPGTCDALTTSVDLFATLADLFGIEDKIRQRTHGHSLLPLLEGTTGSVRDWLLAGVWGREVHLIDGTHKYARGAGGINRPISMFSNRWSTMPTHFLRREDELPLPDDRAALDRMPGSNVPVIRQPWGENDRLPYWAPPKLGPNLLFDLKSDPGEETDLSDTPLSGEYADKLHAVLKEVEAPDDQFVRLGYG